MLRQCYCYTAKQFASRKNHSRSIHACKMFAKLLMNHCSANHIQHISKLPMDHRWANHIFDQIRGEQHGEELTSHTLDA